MKNILLLMGVYAGDGMMWTTHSSGNNQEYGLARIDTFFKDQPDPDAYFRYKH